MQTIYCKNINVRTEQRKTAAELKTNVSMTNIENAIWIIYTLIQDCKSSLCRKNNQKVTTLFIFVSFHMRKTIKHLDPNNLEEKFRLRKPFSAIINGKKNIAWEIQ